MKAYEDCLSATSTHHAPWYVVPADDKENARLIISQIILDTLKSLKLSYPETNPGAPEGTASHPETARKMNPPRSRLDSCGQSDMLFA